MVKRICSEPDCEAPHHARGLCYQHYLPLKKLGPLPRITEHERFWEKVDKHGPVPEHRPELGSCWLWTRATSKEGGYGQFSIGRRSVRAHCYAYELLVGPVPEGLTIDHLCRVPACIKAVADEHGPAHLEAVTQAENNHRGNGWSGRNGRKTHCIRGHELTEANIYREPGRPQRRSCRACNAGKKARRRARTA
jgi:HNH endonuclease